jgi:4-alpha-glucanotransferase
VPGAGLQLYALVARQLGIETWPISDASVAVPRGASVILPNSLERKHRPTYEPSPYYASSRRFRNTLYLRIDEIEGADQCAAELQPLRRSSGS